MDLFYKIIISISELEKLNSIKKDIIITTSFITKRLFEQYLAEYCSNNKQMSINEIFGVTLKFDHFENNIIVYDKTKACFDDKFKIILFI